MTDEALQRRIVEATRKVRELERIQELRAEVSDMEADPSTNKDELANVKEKLGSLEFDLILEESVFVTTGNGTTPITMPPYIGHFTIPKDGPLPEVPYEYPVPMPVYTMPLVPYCAEVRTGDPLPVGSTVTVSPPKHEVDKVFWHPV